MPKKNWVQSASPPLKATLDQRVSSFSTWVFEESVKPRKKPKHQGREPDYIMGLGTMDHDRISLFLRTTALAKRLNGEPPSKWKPIFIDTEETKKYFTSSKLLINGNPLRGKPDVVLQHQDNGHIIIIERKTTWLHNKFLPENGWANVQAQLWAYSWMDEWKDAESVTLVGELYLRKGRKNALIRYTDPYFWQKGDTDHERACSEWFYKYGGEIVSA